MSYCKEFDEGKDKVMFLTKEDLSEPSTIELSSSEPAAGLILANGDINWNCPCLGGMATGPCGVEFREAFSCFHYSEAEPKGSDCYEAFSTMQTCFAKFPEVYNKSNTGDDDEEGEGDGFGSAAAEFDRGEIEREALERIDKLDLGSREEEKENKSSESEEKEASSSKSNEKTSK